MKKTCKECNKEYDVKESKLICGDYFYLDDFCSTKCHDRIKATLIKEMLSDVSNIDETIEYEMKSPVHDMNFPPLESIIE